jgi:hypothetical protein
MATNMEAIMAKHNNCPKILDRITSKNPLTEEQQLLRRLLFNLFFLMCPAKLRYAEREVTDRQGNKKKVMQARYMGLGYLPNDEAAAHSPDTLNLKKVLWAIAYAVDQVPDKNEIVKIHTVLLAGMLELIKTPEGKRASIALKVLTHLDPDRASAVYSSLWLGGLKGQATARGHLLAIAEEAGYNKPYRVWVADGKLKGSDDAEAAVRILNWIAAVAGGNKSLVKAFATVVDACSLLPAEERARLTALQGGGATIGERVAAGTG